MVLRNGSKDSFLFFVFIHFSKKHTANKMFSLALHSPFAIFA